MIVSMNCTKYTDEVVEYLRSKLPELPEHVVQEVAAHLGNKTSILVNDVIFAMNREHNASLRKSDWRSRNNG